MVRIYWWSKFLIMPIGNAFTILKSVKIKVPMVQEFSSITNPRGLAVDSFENLYVACEADSSFIKKIEPDGTVSTHFRAITAGETLSVNGLAIDNFDNFYLSDGKASAPATAIYHSNVYTYSNLGNLSTYVLSVGVTTGICIDRNNNLYVSNFNGPTVDKYDSAKVKTFKFGNLTLNQPQGLALDSSDNIYVADRKNHRIYKITKNGVNSIYAGTGIAGVLNGASLNAQFNTPIGLCFDEYDNLYVAEFTNHTIRKITPSGQVSTIAGTAGLAGDKLGVALSTQLKQPTWLAYKNGIIYISDTGNNKIKKLIL